jgi:glyoxylase-like metal-dependent hydrolase (beta-lactamase superfamily II)
MTDGITIDCDDCRFQGTDACQDCVVTFICGREPDDALIIDAAEHRAVRLLAEVGLVPDLRHVRRSG